MKKEDKEGVAGVIFEALYELFGELSVIRMDLWKEKAYEIFEKLENELSIENTQQNKK
jgi:hypothetical protein